LRRELEALHVRVTLWPAVHPSFLLPPHTPVSTAGQPACCRLLIVPSSSIRPQPPAPMNHPCTPTLSPRHQHAQHTQPASITISFSPCIAGDVAASRVASVFGESFIIPSPYYLVVASRSRAAMLITTAYDRAARAKPSSGTYGLPLHRPFQREKACPFNPPPPHYRNNCRRRASKADGHHRHQIALGIGRRYMAFCLWQKRRIDDVHGNIYANGVAVGLAISSFYFSLTSFLFYLKLVSRSYDMFQQHFFCGTNTLSF
jgi:hypothetical protein